MRLISQSPKDTLRIGRAVARKLKPGNIICLFGELGSGKTIFTKGIARGLGLKEEEIASPSFVLLRHYPQARIPLYHFDFYRLKGSSDILALGFEEFLYSDGITVIEWPQRLKGFLPEECLKIEILIKGKQKRLLKIDENIGH